MSHMCVYIYIYIYVLQIYLFSQVEVYLWQVGGGNRILSFRLVVQDYKRNLYLDLVFVCEVFALNIEVGGSEVIKGPAS